MSTYVWTSEDGQFGVASEPELKHETVHFDAVFIPTPQGKFRATYAADGKTPIFQNIGAVDKTKEQSARAALKAFSRARAEPIKELQREALRRRKQRLEGGRGR